ncbi:diacylglycerol kinase family protein [Sphingobacterium hungaricum]|uniref:Diacylglycerol kinase n=1 Tax=Sphingobacterium hungaricum TaxID=2082723 RepID=A0A928YS43_9SPHI|nr:diacylglycerol kinase family protein [Sphingobacterium hungaricum]MBE8715347.1 diacylglycerol kinase [Sphingobacterium hungaricum]
MKQEKFSPRKRLNSFSYAINGLKTLWIEEHNARIHFFLAISVILMGLYFKITIYDWMAVFFAIGFVLVTEIINTAIENISDFISAERDNRIKKIKDISAGAVLISSITAFIIGLLVFAPKFLILFQSGS